MTPLRASLYFPANAVPDTGMRFRGKLTPEERKLNADPRCQRPTDCRRHAAIAACGACVAAAVAAALKFNDDPRCERPNGCKRTTGTCCNACRMRAFNADPKNRAHHRARMQEINADPLFRQRRAASARAYYLRKHGFTAEQWEDFKYFRAKVGAVEAKRIVREETRRGKAEGEGAR